MADRLGSSISSSSAKSSQRMTATFLPFVFVVSFFWCILPFHSILPRLVQAEGDAHISISNTTGGQRRGPALSFFGIDNSTSSSISSGISDRTEDTGSFSGRWIGECSRERNHPAQEEVVGCESRCGARAKGKRIGMTAGRDRKTTLFRHPPSAVGRMANFTKLFRIDDVHLVETLRRE